MSRDLFARAALELVPKILTLQDRNPHSPTFGCFDRNFWHYRILDFPSGMAQELVWPLALVHSLPLPDNPYHGKHAVRQSVVAGIRYAAASAHSDASCDDYFPYERAGGAAAFSLLAMVESAALVGLDDPSSWRFLERRADWLAGHDESGRLTNHQALIALALERLGSLRGVSRWTAEVSRRVQRVLSWQNPEGWFQEYEGCDLGYQTLTISLLAGLQQVRPRAELQDALAVAVRFAAEFVYPDGSFGGELGSRDTFNFFPHGFELAGPWMPDALAVNDRFLAGLAAGLAPSYADDHILGHHAWNYLLAWRDFVPERPPARERAQGRTYFPQAGLLVDRNPAGELYAALHKGGVFKLFREGSLVASDTQISLLVGQGSRSRNAVGHLVGGCRVDVEDLETQRQESAGPWHGPSDADAPVRVSGHFGWSRQQQMTPARLVLLRLAMLLGGRLFPNAVRGALQRLLITGKPEAPFEFTRTFRWREGALEVTDRVDAMSWDDVRAAGIGGDQTSIYTAMSRTFQAGQLQPWLDLSERVRHLERGQPLVVERLL